MNRILSRLLIATLALALLATAQGMAVARGANPAVDQITLCTGHGPMPLYLDADGAPTEPPHLCPDCAVFLAALPDESPQAVRATQLSQQQVPARPDVTATPPVGLLPPARGPPVTV